MNCPRCDLPMAWSPTRQIMWCSVYGRHLEPGRTVMLRTGVVGDVVRLDVERERRKVG